MATKKKPAKKRTVKRKEPSWDEIGDAIGKKVEVAFSKMDKKKFDNSCCSPWWAMHCHHREGGGFGRLLFIIALLYILSFKGMLAGIPTWNLVLLVLGFWWMRL